MNAANSAVRMLHGCAFSGGGSLAHGGAVVRPYAGAHCIFIAALYEGADEPSPPWKWGVSTKIYKDGELSLHPRAAVAWAIHDAWLRRITVPRVLKSLRRS